MEKQVEFIEHTTGNVTVDVPEDATLDDIEEAALEKIDGGNAFYANTEHDIILHDYQKLNFENLFDTALAEKIDNVGGDIETALDNFGIYDEKQRKMIKEWFGWEEECPDDLPESLNLSINDLNYEDGDDLDEKIAEYLSDQYGFCVNGFCIESTDMTTGDIRITEIDWDTED